MSKRSLVTIVSIIGIGIIVAVVFSIAEASSCCSDHMQKPEKDMKEPAAGETLSLEKIHSENLLVVSESIEKATEAIKIGDDDTALAELHKASKMLAIIHDAIGAHIKPAFANVRCPIMGSPIMADKVTKELIREYKGQRIAFCCGGCPAMWDKLTEAEKESKLAKAKLTVTENHSGHKH